jgi:hypothetical protein
VQPSASLEDGEQVICAQKHPRETASISNAG